MKNFQGEIFIRNLRIEISKLYTHKSSKINSYQINFMLIK